LDETWRRLKTAKKLLRQNYFRKSLTSLFKVPVYFKRAVAGVNRDLYETFRRLKDRGNNLLKSKYILESLFPVSSKSLFHLKDPGHCLTWTCMRLLGD